MKTSCTMHFSFDNLQHTGSYTRWYRI